MTKADGFWRVKPLAEMSKAEWESLCDGCGRCCLHKLRDEDTDEISFTNVACRLLDLKTSRCSDYPNRRKKIPDCVQLTPAKLETVDWLPPTCAYRLLGEGKDLYPWHPLISGRAESVQTAGVAVAGRALSERDAGPLEHHLVTWPGEVPNLKRKMGASG
ncbi:MAG: YcgN family cysteine cluster protein [Acidocella sp.]|nr:YcgN family cysteine cluster protein [Acidocella sp.]